MKKGDIHVWKGCNPVFAKTIDAFSECWGPYSTKSRRHSIFSLVREQIDPAWLQYLATLQDTAFGNNLLQELPPGEFAKQFGFRALEDWTTDIILSYLSLSELTNQVVDSELVATLETLRTVSYRCGGKQPHRTAKKGRNTQRARPICELCGQPTELEAYRRQDANIDMGVIRLSGRYCTDHRPWDHAKNYNPDYKRAIRHKAQFDEEVLRLGRQTGSRVEPRAESGDPAVDLFIFRIVAPRMLYTDDIDHLRNLARKLVDDRVTDDKKRMVILAAAGMDQSDIASQLGISRQSINKALKTIPPEYRFDKQRRGRSGWPT